MNVKILFEKYDVRRPRSCEPFRVYPDYDAPQIIYLTEINQRFFLVHPTQSATTSCARYALFLCVNNNAEYFFWPIKAENLDNSWMKTAYEAAYLAMWNWIQVTSSKSSDKYKTEVVESIQHVPVWPGTPYDQLVLNAFEDRTIHDSKSPSEHLHREVA